MFKEKKKKIMPILKKHVHLIEVTYDGHGDDGQIEEIRGYLQNDLFDIKQKLGVEVENKGLEVDLKNIHEKWEVDSSQYDDKTQLWIEKKEEKLLTLEKIIEDFCYALLDYENFEFDWVNNEGGYGTVYIYVDKNHIKVEHNARISTTEYSEREY